MMAAERMCVYKRLAKNAMRVEAVLDSISPETSDSQRRQGK